MGKCDMHRLIEGSVGSLASGEPAERKCLMPFNVGPWEILLLLFGLAIVVGAVYLVVRFATRESRRRDDQ